MTEEKRKPTPDDFKIAAERLCAPDRAEWTPEADRVVVKLLMKDDSREGMTRAAALYIIDKIAKETGKAIDTLRINQRPAPTASSDMRGLSFLPNDYERIVEALCGVKGACGTIGRPDPALLQKIAAGLAARGAQWQLAA